MGRLPVTPAQMAVGLLVVGVVLLAVGLGVWIAPGAGLTAGGLALIVGGLFGVDLDRGPRRRGNR